ncbi:MAG: uridine kinase [Bdellovibrionota bacterium]
MMKKPYLLGVAGGSGSGKTYFAQSLIKELGPDICEVVYQDNFYFDQSKRFDHDGGSVNFDHPNSIDFSLLAQKLVELKQGQHVEIPIYDFHTHTRSVKTLPVAPKPIVIVDGILIFHAEPVRALFDDLIFFETPEELRYSRRLERDVKERGRTPDGVRSQFLKQVKPMHDQFVAPSKVFAKTIVEDTGQFAHILDEVCRRVRGS